MEELCFENQFIIRRRVLSLNRQEFFRRLEYLLRGIPENERMDALAYYSDYFDDAGVEATWTQVAGDVIDGIVGVLTWIPRASSAAIGLAFQTMLSQLCGFSESGVIVSAEDIIFTGSSSNEQVNILNINIEDMLEMYDAIFEIYIEDRLINRQQMQAPKEILMTNFIQTVQQIQNDKRPIKFKMIVPYVFWDEFEKKQKVLNNGLELDNHAMTAWAESRKV